MYPSFSKRSVARFLAGCTSMMAGGELAALVLLLLVVLVVVLLVSVMEEDGGEGAWAEGWLASPSSGVVDASGPPSPPGLVALEVLSLMSCVRACKCQGVWDALRARLPWWLGSGEQAECRVGLRSKAVRSNPIAVAATQTPGSSQT